MEDMYEHIDTSLLYTSTSIPGIGCPELFDEEFSEGCNCSSNSCCTNAFACGCIKGNMLVYDENLQLKWPVPTYPIFECNEKCSCSQHSCRNRSIQRGPNKMLDIKPISDIKGLGLICKEKIFKGSFVCTYAGEILGLEEGQKRAKLRQAEKKPNYIIFVNEVFSEKNVPTVIDPTTIGNIGRYVNHSCDPNLIMLPVRIQNLVPHLALFAAMDIPKDTELTFDYGNPSLALGSSSFPKDLPNLNRNEKESLVTCLCNKSKCRKYLPYQK